MNKNDHVISYLDYYTNLKTSPQFALLLKGNWGCGKSNLVKRYIETKNEKDYILVSLYGLSSFSEIDETIFTQLHPVLGSKTMKLTGRVLKGLLKATIKVDLDGNGKEEGSVSPNLPDINLPDYLKKTDNKVLVFDDLERCALPIDAVLGYINQYVEVIGQKVIIVANEDEIIKTASSKYTLIREKVIGKSFMVNSDFEAAFFAFRNQIGNSEHKRILNEQSQVIGKIFNESGYDNLRHVRQTVLEYSQFLNCLSQNAIQKKELVSHLTELFFAISFELKKGELKDSEIYKFFRTDFLAGLKDDDPIKLLRNKYPVFNRYYHPVSDELLAKFFRNGIVDKEPLEQQISNSSYFQNANTPDSIKLWRYYELNDDEFEVIKERVLKKFEENTFDNQYELAHVVGILIALRQNKLLKLTYKEILSAAKKSCKHLGEQNRFAVNKFEFILGNSYAGLAFQSTSHPTFIEFNSFLNSSIEKHKDLKYKAEAVVLLGLLKTDFEQAWQKLIFMNNMESYYQVPIMKYFKAKEIYEVIVSLSNKDKTLFSQVIDERYKHTLFRDKLKEEKKVLVDLKKIIESERAKRKRKISGLLIERQLEPALETAIKLL